MKLIATNSRVAYYDQLIEQQLVGYVLRLVEYKQLSHAHVRHRYGETLIDVTLLQVMPEPSQHHAQDYCWQCNCDYCQQYREVFNGGAEW